MDQLELSAETGESDRRRRRREHGFQRESELKWPSLPTRPSTPPKDRCAAPGSPIRPDRRAMFFALAD